MRRLGREGWTVLAAEASTTEKGRASGGTAVIAKQHLAQRAAGEASEGDCQRRWTLSKIRLKEVTLVIGAVYLFTEPQVGVSGRNLLLLEEVGKAIKKQGLLFVLGGDWNLTQAELRETEWLDHMGAQTIQVNSDATCRSGKGRVIDYFVCSRPLASVLGESSLDRSWVISPHWAVTSKLASRPREILVYMHMPPKEIPPPAKGPHRKEALWQRAQVAAIIHREQKPCRSWHPVIEKHLAKHPEKQAVVKLTNAYREWVDTIEQQACALADIPDEDRGPYLGRAEPPKFCWVPAVAKEAMAPSPYMGAAHQWGLMVNRLKELQWLSCSSSTRTVGMGGQLAKTHRPRPSNRTQ